MIVEELNKQNSPEAAKVKADLEKTVKKMNLIIFKQDKLFFVVVKILRNIAEDLSIEKKMKKRNIITHLVKLLDRKHSDLVISTLELLKKLSIIEENKDQMVSLRGVSLA